MNKIITNRQIICATLLLSIAPVHKHIPKAVASVSGSSGYISVIIGGLISFLFTFGVFYLIKKFPAGNLNDILKTLYGNVFSKIILLVFVFWSTANLVTVLHFHSLMAQSSLMPFSTDYLIFFIMLLLVGYCIYKGIKVAMRISELLISLLLFIILGLILIALQNFNATNLLPVCFSPDIIKGVPCGASIFGFIIFALFYADKFEKPQTSFKPYFYYCLTSLLIALTITVVTIGVEGAPLTAAYTFPFYSVIQRASLINIFERLEAFLLMPTFISDFVQLVFFMSALLLSLQWLFNIKPNKIGGLIVFVLIYVTALFVEKTQFELEDFYYNFLIYFNTAFEYGIIILSVIMTFIKHKKIKKEIANA